MKDLKQVRDALDKLEELPKTLETRLEELRTRKGILTKLDAEHEFKILASELFGSESADELRSIVTNYLLSKYDKLRDKITEIVVSGPNYIEDLFDSLEDPEVTDDIIKHSDTFGEVGKRSGLETELIRGLSEGKLNKYYWGRIKLLTCSLFDPVVKNSGLEVFGRFLSDFSNYSKYLECVEEFDVFEVRKYVGLLREKIDKDYEDELVCALDEFELKRESYGFARFQKPKYECDDEWVVYLAKKLVLIDRYENIFVEGFKSVDLKTQTFCLGILGSFNGAKARLPEFEYYSCIVEAARNTNHPNYRQANEVLLAVQKKPFLDGELFEG